MSPTASRIGRKHRPDYLLIITVGILLLAGLVIIYSISPVLSHKLLGDVSENYFLYGQLLHVSLGLAAFLVTSNLYYGRWKKWVPFLVIASGLSLLLLAIPGIGVSKNGATRWVDLGLFSYQPAELIKFTLVLGLSTYFASLPQGAINQKNRGLWPMVGLLLGLAALVVFMQRDMGTMLVMVAIVVGIFFSAGVSLKQLGILLGIGTGLGVASILLFPHRIARVLTFLNPDQDVGGSGYHLNQALIAIGSGGFLGLGIGKSIQVYGYLPEAANDSIFAIIGETFGFVGAMVMIGLFILLLYRGFRVAQNAPNQFAQLVVVGILLWIGTQAIVNVGAMVGIIPLTGVPLPFLSYGGTSLVLTMAAVGILVNISKYTERRSYADSALRRRDRRTYNADPSYRRGSETA